MVEGPWPKVRISQISWTPVDMSGHGEGRGCVRTIEALTGSPGMPNCLARVGLPSLP